MKLPYRIRKIYDSALFQGASFPKGYFEGWYFKLTTPGSAELDSESFAVIPGISVSDTGVRHAFIQSIDGRNGQTRYTEYPIETFSFSKQDFTIRIGNSHFSRHGLKLNVHEGDHNLEGTVDFHDVTDIPRTFLSPTIMGWYRYVPRMECYHGVVSIDHTLTGDLTVEGREFRFDGGRGYIEKDYGTSFPSSWIWMQTNRFETPGVSFMLSIAKIPWFGKSFVGLLGFLKTPDTLHRFGTYAGTQIVDIKVTDTYVAITLDTGVGKAGNTSNSNQLRIKAIKGKPGGLKAPVRGAMERVIAESVAATIEIQLSGTTVFSAVGSAGGLEIAGDYSELLEGHVGRDADSGIQDNNADNDVQ